MIFAPYNDLDINLEELEKNNEIQKCLSDIDLKLTVTDRKKLGKKHKIYNIKCNKIEEDEKKIKIIKIKLMNIIIIMILNIYLIIVYVK